MGGTKCAPHKILHMPLAVCLKGEIVITIRPYGTLYLLRPETHLNKVCTALFPISPFGFETPVI